MNTQAIDRFTKDLDKYQDIYQWMRMNLCDEELEYLRCGACAFCPDSGLEGATKEVLQTFYNAFADKGLCDGDGYWYEKWIEEQDQDGSESESGWPDWTKDEWELALTVSDILSDVACYDEVNPLEPLTLDKTSLMESIESWLGSDDPSLVAHAYRVAEYGGFSITHIAAKVLATTEKNHLSSVLNQESVDKQEESVAAHRL